MITECQWLPIGEGQKDGSPHLIACDRGYPHLAVFKGGTWRFFMRVDVHIGWKPTHYLANIPPMPEPVKAPSAEECIAVMESIVQDMVLHGMTVSGEAGERMLALLARAREARQ